VRPQIPKVLAPPQPEKTDSEPPTVHDDLSFDNPVVTAAATAPPPVKNVAETVVAETETRPPRPRSSRYDAELPQPVASPESGASGIEGHSDGSPASDVQDVEEPSSTGLQRTQDESGSEVVEGVIRVRFDKGQKRANLHVPFSPPLAGMPDVECESVGDEPLRLKVPVRQSYGIRIEVRRSNADAALDTEVGFAATCTPE
jgi:hypothetical protein